ncbi:MAG: ABC transporter permease [Eubacteriales bacterium]|nr:ABC transporter permease [Eubacteriales bacterium]
MKIKRDNSNLKSRLLLVGVMVVVYVTFATLSPERFANANTLYIIFQQAFMSSVIAAGLYFIIIMGLFDFAIGSILVFSGILGGLAAQHTGYAGFIIVTIVVAIALEIVNGLLYMILKVPSMITSVGLLMILESIATFFNDGCGVALEYEMRLFGRAPYNIIIGTVGLIIASILFGYTKKGIQIRAIGSNELVARSAGIRVNQAKLWGYIFCGLLVGIGSIMNISYGGKLQPALNLSSIDRNYAPLLGCFFGLAFKDQINPMVGILIGGFIIKLLTTGLMTLGVDATIQSVLTGFVLLLVVALTMRNSRDMHVIVK